ncbi:hypothetical protein LUI11_17375 [Bradyrhizobium diazoefficiens]|nr:MULTISPECIES: hypothetical protein [Bradyrhizobium]APO55869.1 hypothetical protein BD122_36320 [Bradyrhizobium diazoefficiens]KOY07681.1 hypothetical protein AF336_23080 [Bradyrhizobium diazoefficiens]MCD9293504.1 hypothetical protein [Bradyrhizobium diazoefficiens]MCD9808505.1 hypothetical protein [Bradyrhizobium diazoefficiens]MCD9827293.1 hypothetical protein [Bradyrhizobium diazoefficiens]
MAAVDKVHRVVLFFAGAGIFFFVNRQSLFLLLSWGLNLASAAYLSSIFIYGCLFFLCDWMSSRERLRKPVYFFLRGASLAALYLAPYLVPAVAPIGSSTYISLLIVVSAIIIFAGQLLMRIMFSVTEERSFYG